MARKVLLFIYLVVSVCAAAQNSPNFVTYDHCLEDKGDLEISTQSTIGLQKDKRPTYWAPLLEFEYGATSRWTTSLYLEGTSQTNDATVFTGFRWENRLQPLKAEHAINPVFYFEFENINEASRIQKEVVGHAEEGSETIRELRGAKARELEAKLILSSKIKAWILSTNFVVEKNLSNEEGFEFGYAAGAYRPLQSDSHKVCRWCKGSLSAGVEVYGGLGTLDRFSLRDTAQYVAPGLLWRPGAAWTLKIAPSFGVTAGSARMLMRVGLSFEWEDFGPRIAKMLR
jgi:hypothetical protein